MRIAFLLLVFLIEIATNRAIAASMPSAIRKVNAALTESLRLVIAPPSQAQLSVIYATRSPLAINVTGDYARVQNRMSFAVHLEQLTYRAQEEELQIVGAVSFSPLLRKQWKIPLETALLETFLREQLDQHLGPNLKSATTSIVVRPVRPKEWHIELGYRLMAHVSESMARALECSVELSPQLAAGKCTVGLDSTSVLGLANRKRTQEFVEGLLRTDPAALQWWVDFVASWDGWVRTLFSGN